MRRFLAVVLPSLLIPILAAGQAPHRIAIRAGKLIEGRSDKPVENALMPPGVVVSRLPLLRSQARNTSPAGPTFVEDWNRSASTSRNKSAELSLIPPGKLT